MQSNSTRNGDIARCDPTHHWLCFLTKRPNDACEASVTCMISHAMCCWSCNPARVYMRVEGRSGCEGPSHLCKTKGGRREPGIKKWGTVSNSLLCENVTSVHPCLPCYFVTLIIIPICFVGWCNTVANHCASMVCSLPCTTHHLLNGHVSLSLVHCVMPRV
jgi:hypothetical protein